MNEWIVCNHLYLTCIQYAITQNLFEHNCSNEIVKRETKRSSHLSLTGTVGGGQSFKLYRGTIVVTKKNCWRNHIYGKLYHAAHRGLLGTFEAKCMYMYSYIYVLLVFEVENFISSRLHLAVPVYSIILKFFINLLYWCFMLIKCNASF